MKRSFLYTLLFFSFHLQAQEPAPIVSKSYHWDEAEMTTNDIRMRRYFLKGSTRDLAYLEMHVTTLKPGIQSHPTHTHRPAEIILMIEGESQEQIDDNFYRGQAGDFYFLGSETLHTIKNIGDQPCTYFAFQFN